MAKSIEYLLPEDLYEQLRKMLIVAGIEAPKARRIKIDELYLKLNYLKQAPKQCVC